MPRFKVLLGFLFFISGCCLAMCLLAMLLDDTFVYSGSLMLWLGTSSLLLIFTGLFILMKGNS
jgi:hypothetical protein